MYAIEQTFDGQVRVVDARRNSLFQGSFRECEDWLDLRENTATGAAPSAALRAGPTPVWEIVAEALVWSLGIVLTLHAMFIR